MKNTAPQKDRLLKEILQEITDEHHASNPALTNHPIKPRTKKTRVVKLIENSVIVLLVVLIIFLLFYPKQTAQEKNATDRKTDVSKTHEEKKAPMSAPKTETKKAPSQNTLNQTPATAILSEESKPAKKEKEVFKPEKTKTPREIAKEKLREQLRN